MNELKPCPFCGSKATVENIKKYTGGVYDEFKIVSNHEEDCIFQYMYWHFFCDTKEEAMRIWNRRVEDERKKAIDDWNIRKTNS